MTTYYHLLLIFVPLHIFFGFFLSQCQILLTDIESVWFATPAAVFTDMWLGGSDICCFPFVTVIPAGTTVVPYTTAVYVLLLLLILLVPFLLLLPLQ